MGESGGGYSSGDQGYAGRPWRGCGSGVWTDAILAAHKRGAQVVGICGGYQMAGEWLTDPLGMEGAPGGQAAGLGLLPVKTEFLARKETHQARMRLDDGEAVRGYEIHTGDSRVEAGAARFGEIVERGRAAGPCT